MSRSIGIALGGGAVLGTAHIGVLKAMEEADIRTRSVSGTSIGALVGALYAFGVTIDELESIALDLNRPGDIIDVLSNTFDIGFRNMFTRPFDQEWTIPVQPELNGYSKTDIRKTRELIEKGYEAAKNVFSERSDIF